LIHIKVGQAPTREIDEMDRRSNHLAALFVDTVLDFLRYEEDRDRIATVLTEYGLQPVTVDRILAQQRRSAGARMPMRSSPERSMPPSNYLGHP